MEEQRLLGVRLGVTWHDQPAAIGGRQRHIQHLNRGKFFQHCSRCQSGSERLETMFQRHREAVRQEGNQDVRLHPMLQLMVDRTNPQIALQTFEGRFDLCELHVAVPQDSGIFGYQVRAQQIVAIAQLRFFELGLVELNLGTAVDLVP